MLDRGADIGVQDQHGTTLALALENQKVLTERLQEPLRDGYNKVKAALERRQAAEGAEDRQCLDRLINASSRA